MAKRPSPDTTWGPEGCGDHRPKKFALMLVVLMLRLLLIMACHPWATWRYIRHGE